MPDDDFMLSSSTVEFREEERRHRADDADFQEWQERHGEDGTITRLKAGRDEDLDYEDEDGPEEDDR